jgi:hypothetical protein
MTDDDGSRPTDDGLDETDDGVDGTDEDEGLGVGDLVPAEGGTWRGLLFDNPSIGLAPQLTWTFAFPFDEVDRDYGTSPVALDIDWVPLAVGGWRTLAGQRVECDGFGEPVESSLYFFMHHRFDAVALRIAEQDEQKIHVLAEVTGDLDRLGIAALAVDAWLGFTGIMVALHDVGSEAEALARLGDFTDPDGLSVSGGGAGTRFLFSANGPRTG